MNTGTIFLLLLLACPLMMMWMMRGGHGAHGTGGHAGHGGHGGGHDHSQAKDAAPSLDELRQRRDEIDRAIADREALADSEAHEECEPVGVQTGERR